MSKYIEKFWDESAKDYRFKQWEKTRVARFDYACTKDILLKFLKPNKNDRILEIGCGSGKWSKIISTKCKKLIATDISKKMIEEAKMHCRNKNIHFIRADFMKLDIEQKFDKIYAIRSIEYIKDKTNLLDKIKLLLKENGKVVIVTKNKLCLWDMTKKVKNFWQEKISYTHLINLMKRNSFQNIIIKPVVIRLPIFVSGNREFPLIRKNYESLVLNFFKKITKIAQTTKIIRNLLLPFSESYLIYGEKH